MRKGIKILGKVCAAVLLIVVLLPLVLSVVLGIPFVQNAVVDFAARKVSAALETTVSIRSVDLSWTGKVKVRGFYVEDYQRDTLLYVDRLDAFVTGTGLFGGGLSFSRGEIAGARLYLRETPEGVMNIKQIVSRLSDPDKPRKGNFRLSLHKASVEDMDLCLDRLSRRDPPYGIDFGHMHLYGLRARVDDLTIDGQAIYTTIGCLAARECSGFSLDHLSGRFYMVNGCMGFEDALIVTERSRIPIPYISLVGDSWAVYKEFLGEVCVDGVLRDASLSTDDIAYFAPGLRDWHTEVGDIDIELSGEVDDLKARIAGMRIGEATRLAAEASVRGLPDIRRAHFDLDITRLTSSAPEIDRLARSVGGRELSDGLLGMLDRSGDLELAARFCGTLSEFDLDATLKTAVGDLECALDMTPHGGGLQRVRGEVRAADLRLGDLTGRRDLLGEATLRARIDGTVGRGHTDAHVSGRIERLGFNGYVYDSLRLDGRLRDRGFDGRIEARDPNLDFDFAGMVDFNDSIPDYDFRMHLRRADLARLNVNRRDTLSRLSGRLAARGSGRTLDDLNGSIRISEAVYEYNGKRIGPASLRLSGVNSADSKWVELRSDFADVTFRSKTDYRTVFEYLRRSAYNYLPLISGRHAAGARAPIGAVAADDYSLLTVLVRDFNPVSDAVSPGLQIADSSSLRLMFNPVSDRLTFSARSEYVERGDMLATRLNLNATNRGDSLVVYGAAEDLYAGMVHLPHLSVSGGAKQGRMQLSTGFTDTVRRLSGLVGVHAEIADEAGPAGRVVDLRILPSHLTRGDMSWQIFARKIQFDTARVVIDRFYVMNREQELLVDGVASRNSADSLTLSLRNFDLAPLSQVADRMGYAIEGRTTGGATMTSLLGGGQVTADILVDSLAVNGIPGPPLRLTSRWDFARNRAGVFVMNRQKRDTLVRGFYDPAQVRYYARLAVDSLDMGLLDPILSGVISETHGLASVDLVLQGRRRAARLSGGVRVRDLSTKVDFTQVRYRMPEATLVVEGNRFRAVNVPMFDPEGNRGRFDLDLNLEHLSNISYDVRVRPERMLVLDTSEEDNDAFYGQVYATGSVRVTGDKGQVGMDIVAATDDNTSFFMPLSSKANIAYADFVRFVEPRKEDAADVVALKKRLFERRRKRRDEAGSQMDIALALDVRPNAELELTVSGNTLKARGAGALNLQINPRTNLFEMYGDYSLTEGSFRLSLMNLYNKNFSIEPGSTIQWTGSPMDARLDIDAVYRLKASLQPLLQGTSDKLASDRSVPVECVIRLGERLTDPSVTFDVLVSGADPEIQTIVANALSTPESVDQQFAALLIFNSFMAENSLSGGSNLGASMGAGTGLEFVSGMLSNWLSTSGYNVAITYRPKTETAGDEVDFGLSKSLVNNRLFVEVEGNYLIDNRQAVNSAMSNFMGEAYITYLIDRAGTLRLKAFTQTIDRFDENQGLQETGLGIYFKEDFDDFRDFRRRVKERFTNRKRQERRAARRAAKERRRERAAGKALSLSADDADGSGTAGVSSAPSAVRFAVPAGTADSVKAGRAGAPVPALPAPDGKSGQRE